MSCEFAHADAAYVLGSLDPAERSAFERHLAECPECARAVRELAGMPGLLARVPEEVLETVLEDPGAAEPVPDTLWPRVVTQVRRDRRRGVVRTAALAVAAVLVVIAGAVTVVALASDDAPPTAGPAEVTTAPAREMESVGDGWVTGWVSLTEVPWGTRIDLTCSYDTDQYGAEAIRYDMVVRTDDGATDRVGSWQAEPGEEAHVVMATAASPEEIAEVEVRTADGTSVLQLVP